MQFDPETTIDEFKTMNKIKMVKNLILYLQDVPRFGKFFNYGCHCFRNEGRDYLKGVIQKENFIHKPKNKFVKKISNLLYILLIFWSESFLQKFLSVSHRIDLTKFAAITPGAMLVLSPGSP